jgi:hypothetical protein
MEAYGGAMTKWETHIARYLEDTLCNAERQHHRCMAYYHAWLEQGFKRQAQLCGDEAEYWWQRLRRER